VRRNGADPAAVRIDVNEVPGGRRGGVEWETSVQGDTAGPVSKAIRYLHMVVQSLGGASGQDERARGGDHVVFRSAGPDSVFTQYLDHVRRMLQEGYSPNDTSAGKTSPIGGHTGAVRGEDVRDPDQTPHVIVIFARDSEPFKSKDGTEHSEYHASIQVSAEAATVDEASEMIRSLNAVLKACNVKRQMWAIPAVHSSRRKVVRVSTFALAVQDNLESCLERLSVESPDAEVIELLPSGTGEDWNVDLHAKGHTSKGWGKYQSEFSKWRADEDARQIREEKQRKRDVEAIIRKLQGKQEQDY
jgi:hypothetical protein